MIEVLSMTFAAGEVKTFQMPGEYFELLDTMYPVDVMLMQRDGTQLSRLMSAEASYFTRPGRFETYTIYSANAQTVRWFIGSGDAGTRRTSGVVQVVDGGKARTKAGAAFMNAIAAAAVAGQVSSTQLWNPAASGTNLVLKAMSLGSTVAGTLRTGFLNAALANTSPPVSVSKLAGGGIGAGQLHFSNQAGVLAPAPSLTVYVAASQTLPVTFQEPIVIPPGWGFCVESITQNVVVISTFEWTEENIA